MCFCHFPTTTSFCVQPNRLRKVEIMNSYWNWRAVFSFFLIGLNEMKGKCYFSDPAFFSYCQHSAVCVLIPFSHCCWKLDTSRKWDLACIFLCHPVWALSDSVFSPFQKKKNKQRWRPLSFLPHFMVISSRLVCHCRCVAHCLGKCV